MEREPLSSATSRMNAKIHYWSRRGSALLIALSMVVLMTVLVLLLISRSNSNVLMSNASAHAGSADLYSHGVINQIVGDLKQEIAAGSSVVSVTPSNGGIASVVSPTVCIPLKEAYAVTVALQTLPVNNFSITFK
jgi:hypothetical protein